MTRNPWRTVASKLVSVAGYACFRYRLRKCLAREADKGRNDLFSGYPGNHTYAIRNGQLVPGFQLFERFQQVAALLSPEMDSFLDVGCCRGFYVLRCALRPGCRLAVGVDVYAPFVSDAQRAMRCLRLENCGWHVATLDDLALDPPGFGGPFHTVLNIGTYHYLYWGSNLCPTAFFDHREILRRFASLCTDRFIISARFEVDRLPSFVRATAQFHEKKSNYTTKSFLHAAAEFFEVRHQGFLGAYPLLLLLKK